MELYTIGMAKIKPLEIEEEERDLDKRGSDGFPPDAPMKVAFLIGIIAVGAFFGWYFQAYKTEIQERTQKAVAKPTPIPPFAAAQNPTSAPFVRTTDTSDTPQIRTSPSARSGTSSRTTSSTSTSTSVPTTRSRPEPTTQPASGDLISMITNQGAGIIDSSFKQASDFGGSILGEATKQVQNTATESAKQAGDSLYQSTIGAIIQQLLNQLPKQSQQELLKDLCDDSDTSCN